MCCPAHGETVLSTEHPLSAPCTLLTCLPPAWAATRPAFVLPRRYGAALEGHLSTCDALLDTVKQVRAGGSAFAPSLVPSPATSNWRVCLVVLGICNAAVLRLIIWTCAIPPHQILDLFERLREQHRTVATRTSALHGTCERLVAERRCSTLCAALCC